MKRVFLNQSKAVAVPFSIALAVSLAVGTATAGHADVKSLWNPKHWFNSTQAAQQAPSDAVSEAQKKAEEAQQAANQAMQDAQRALEKAAEARRQAEALEKAPQARSTKKHLVVTSPAPIETAADKAAEPTTQTAEKAERVYQAPNTVANTSPEPSATVPGKKEPWNPMSWFHKENEDRATGLDGSIPQEKATSKVEPEAEQASKTSTANADTTEAASTQKHGSWTLKNFFTKPSQPESAQGNDTTKQATEDKAPSQPETTADTKNTDKTSGKAEETSTASSQSKNGGWNLLNLLSKPALPPSSQAVTPQATETDKAPKADSAETEQSLKSKAAVIETERGNIAIELYPDQAPLTVSNFAKLVNEGFYNRYNMKFHRVVPGFVIQTGDPTGTGAGGSKERVPLEAKNKLSHNAKGIVAMARGADPNSATSQFYITLAPQAALDGKYAVFGKVISGIDVLSKIEKDDMLYGIRLVDITSVVRDPQPEKKHFFSSLPGKTKVANP